MSNLDIPLLNERLERLSAEEILRWAWETLGPKIAASSSFQTQSVPLLHIISRVSPKMPVIFIDTGFHFPDTLRFHDELKVRFNLNVIVVRPAIEKNLLLQKYGVGLYRRDPDLCCYINKVEPMQRAVSELQGWISGIRRDQTSHRQILHTVQLQAKGLLEIHPMINWTKKRLHAYMEKHRLPCHPLFNDGYFSIGCAPCTRPVLKREDERAGRWAGTKKTECGLHMGLKSKIEERSDKKTA